MKILVIKTSSLGDVIHTLPAITEAKTNFPELNFDWIVEEAFAEIPAWHEAVSKVMPLALRRWRKRPFKALLNGECKKFWQILHNQRYDYIIDAQGLVFKSALISLCAAGTRCGFDWHSAREPLSSFCYHDKVSIDKNQHAILRNRQLFAQVLNYKIAADAEPFYGISVRRRMLDRKLIRSSIPGTVIFIHGTSREDKCWPEEQWRKLAILVTNAGLTVQLPWGNELERARAHRIAENMSDINVLPKLNLTGLAEIFSEAAAAVAVDTGLGHLAAAVGLPTVSIYNTTDPNLIGTWGKNQVHLRSDTQNDEIIDIEAARVWNILENFLL